jgi:hypothetical protein
MEVNSRSELSMKVNSLVIFNGPTSSAKHIGQSRVFIYSPHQMTEIVLTRVFREVQALSMIVSSISVGTPFPAAIDTGTTLIYVPTAIAQAIWNAVDGAKVDKVDTAESGGGTIYEYPCDANLDIRFRFEGNDDNDGLKVDPRDLNLGRSCAVELGW